MDKTGVIYSSGYATMVNSKLHKLLMAYDPSVLKDVIVVDSLPQEAPMIRVGDRDMIVVPNRDNVPRNRKERRRMKYGKKRK